MRAIGNSKSMGGAENEGKKGGRPILERVVIDGGVQNKKEMLDFFLFFCVLLPHTFRPKLSAHHPPVIVSPSSICPPETFTFSTCIDEGPRFHLPNDLN